MTSVTMHPVTGRREQVATRAVFLLAGLAMAAWAPLVPFAKARPGIRNLPSAHLADAQAAVEARLATTSVHNLVPDIRESQNRRR